MSGLVLVLCVAPILAPSVGAAFLAFANWRFIFWFQSLYGASCAILAWRILPETLPESRRIKVGVAQVVTRYGSICENQCSAPTRLWDVGRRSACSRISARSSPVFIRGFGLSPSGSG